MDAQIVDATSRFSDRVLRFLERVEHSVARTPAEREAAFRMRYDAYIKNGLIEPRDDGQMYDVDYDDDPKAWITTTYIDGELAGTTRVNLAVDENGNLPCLGVFRDVIAPRLQAHRVIVELTRTAARLDFSGAFAELPYVTLRPAFLAAEYFDADFAVATARAEHLGFFRRIFRFEPWCEFRDYPGVTTKIACLGSDFRAGKERVAARYPFFRSTAAEREALFGPRERATADRCRAAREHARFEARASA
ncbi:MAG: N-acyl amino acid synthase FeeM domain-containing protein [Roseiarcus sp.]